MFESYHSTYNEFLSLMNLQTKPYCETIAELRHSLARTEAFLQELGAPHEKMKFIHVGGTSGKGSVSNYLHEALLADGRKVATYTSPHTTTYLERFRVGKQLLSQQALTRAMKEVIDAYETFLKHEKGVLSFFELSTCLALYAFHKAGAEWCVLEVGCGGRYDATNVIPPPEIAIITNIDKDHTQILGTSLAQIASKKAGIIKRNSTVICGETRPKLKKIFMNEAIQHNAALFFVGTPEEQRVDIDFGDHQQHNAAIAFRAGRELGIEERTLERALRNAKKLPCRFEFIQKKPVIVLDGAHSPVKVQASADRIKDLFGKAHIIFGATATKDSAKMIKALSPVAKSITTTRFKTSVRKVASPNELLDYVPKTKRNGAFLNHKDALLAAKKRAKKNEPIVITGSLYLAGEMRDYWISEEQILKNGSSFKI